MISFPRATRPWLSKPSFPVFLCWLTAAVLGAIQACSARHDMNPDGINYLDLSDAFLRGDWEGAVNGTWSPLYPLLLSVARFIVNPSPYWEFATAHELEAFHRTGARAIIAEMPPGSFSTAGWQKIG